MPPTRHMQPQRRILCNRVLKELDALVNPQASVRWFQKKRPLRYASVGVGLDRARAGGARENWPLHHSSLDFRGNVMCCRALQHQHVLQFVVVAAGPKMAIAGGLDHLHANSDSVFFPLHRPFDDSVYP